MPGSDGISAAVGLPATAVPRCASRRSRSVIEIKIIDLCAVSGRQRLQRRNGRQGNRFERGQPAVLHGVDGLDRCDLRILRPVDAFRGGDPSILLGIWASAVPASAAAFVAAACAAAASVRAALAVPSALLFAVPCAAAASARAASAANCAVAALANALSALPSAPFAVPCAAAASARALSAAGWAPLALASALFAVSLRGCGIGACRIRCRLRRGCAGKCAVGSAECVVCGTPVPSRRPHARCPPRIARRLHWRMRWLAVPSALSAVPWALFALCWTVNSWLPLMASVLGGIHCPGADIDKGACLAC